MNILWLKTDNYMILLYLGAVPPHLYVYLLQIGQM